MTACAITCCVSSTTQFVKCYSKKILPYIKRKKLLLEAKNIFLIITTDEIIFTVVTRLEIGRLQSLVNNKDANAFIIQLSMNDIKGGIIKKMPMPKKDFKMAGMGF